MNCLTDRKKALGVRILLVDDHEIILQNLISLLNRQPEIEIIGEAKDGLYAIELTHKLKPDIVITDINMPKMNGIDSAREIIQNYPQTKIIALSGYSHECFVTRMFQIGASAYILKDYLFDDLPEAIKTVTENRKYISPYIAGAIVSKYIEYLSDSNNTILNSLSDTEKKLLNLIADGKSDKQIIPELHKDIFSIEAARNNIMKKLATNEASILVKVAISEQ